MSIYLHFTLRKIIDKKQTYKITRSPDTNIPESTWEYKITNNNNIYIKRKFLIKSAEYNNNKFKISAPTWYDEFNLPDGSYSVSDIQDYFEYIIKKHEAISNNPPVQIFVNKIKNRIVFKIKTGYKLELLPEETMQLLGSSNKVINQNKDGELAPRLETVEVVSVHCNLVNNKYQQASKVLFTFVPNM